MQKTSHAIFNRIYVRLGLVAALVGSFSLNAHAAYANLSPPPGWSQGGSAAWATPSNGFAVQTANQWISNASKTSAMLNVGGKQIALEARLALGPSAPRVMAAYLFKNPYLRLAVGIASWLSTANIVWDATLGKWVTQGSSSTISNGYGWKFDQSRYPKKIYDSPEDACKDAIGTPVGSSYSRITLDIQDPFYLSSGYCFWSRPAPDTGEIGIGSIKTAPNPNCPAGWFISPAGCTQTTAPKPLSEKEMVDLLNPANTPGWPMTDSVPGEFPRDLTLPVQLPVVNPSTGVNPFPRPMFIPTGDPVRNPNYNPAKPQTADNMPYLQPGVKVTPRPTTANPWQVDVQPSDRPQAGPDPLPDTEQNPDAGENDKPREEDSKSLCEKHPEILACTKPELDTPDGEIPKTSRDVSLQEEGLFGGGACPADVYFSPNGLQQMKIWDWNKACGDISTYLKPILIICCTFAAFMILVPGRTE